jgi:hypothetical protein
VCGSEGREREGERERQLGVEGERSPATEGGTGACVGVKGEREEEREKDECRRREMASDRGRYGSGCGREGKERGGERNDCGRRETTNGSGRAHRAQRQKEPKQGTRNTMTDKDDYDSATLSKGS